MIPDRVGGIESAISTGDRLSGAAKRASCTAWRDGFTVGRIGAALGPQLGLLPAHPLKFD